MSQPVPYTRQYSFTDYQTTHPSDPLPGNQVDAELNAVKQTLDQTLSNIAKIQRDDGALANASVGVDQMKPEVNFGLNAVTDWQAGVVYQPNNGVWYQGKMYRCLLAHTATVFATDLAALRWSLLLDVNTKVDARADAYIPTVLPALVSTAVATAVGAKLVSTSTTSLAIGTGAKTLTVQLDEGWAIGMPVKAYETANPNNYMVGYVTAYNTATGQLDFNVPVGYTSGSGTINAWTIVIGGDAAGAVSTILTNFPTVATVAPGAAYAMDLSLSNYFDITLNSATCALSFTNIPSSGKLAEIVVLIRQDSTGGRVVTWPGLMYWSSGAPPSLSTTKNRVDLFYLTTRDGGATWFATRFNSDMAQYLITNASSASFDGSSQWLSQTDGNFGAYTYSKFAIALRIRANTLGTSTRGILNHQNSANGWNLSVDSNSRLRWRTQGGDGQKTMNAALATATWYNVLLHFDSANATAGLRMRMFVNSSTEVSYNMPTNPTVAVTDPGGDVTVGSIQYAGDVGVTYFDGLVSEFGFWDNVLPTYDDVFPASTPSGFTRNWAAIAGLKSWLRMGDNGLLVDEVLASAWTNNGTVTTSATVP